jgi:hypothetical protein
MVRVVVFLLGKKGEIDMSFLRSKIAILSLFVAAGIIPCMQATAWASSSKHGSPYKDEPSCFDPFKVSCHDYGSKPVQPVKMCQKSTCMMLPPCYCPPRSPCMPDHHRKQHCDNGCDQCRLPACDTHRCDMPKHGSSSSCNSHPSTKYCGFESKKKHCD